MVYKKPPKKSCKGVREGGRVEARRVGGRMGRCSSSSSHPDFLRPPPNTRRRLLPPSLTLRHLHQKKHRDESPTNKAAERAKVWARSQGVGVGCTDVGARHQCTFITPLTPPQPPGAVPPPVLMVVLRRAAAAAVLRSASPSVCCIHSISCLLAAVSPIHRSLLWRDHAHRTHGVLLLLLLPHSGGAGGEGSRG